MLGPYNILAREKCFPCHQFRHYATKCPNQKKGSNKEHVETSTEIDEFNSYFNKDFSLISCMKSSVTNNVWYIDSRASFHMIGNKIYFTQMIEKDMQFHIKMQDDGRYLA